ncbi:hypothetical protein [Saccharibacillus kuerlensis]|uniref:hypothetical protein n=1 Tax=Saccharibacillus kuerlensis TaxID=459527 RepID=UPI0012ED8FFE|nr:hypothetical protein [Saccharibacillus kuerlensis]
MNIENQLTVHTREELRRWLQEHGQTAQCCWIIRSVARYWASAGRLGLKRR